MPTIPNRSAIVPMLKMKTGSTFPPAHWYTTFLPPPPPPQSQPLTNSSLSTVNSSFRLLLKLFHVLFPEHAACCADDGCCGQGLGVPNVDLVVQIDPPADLRIAVMGHGGWMRRTEWAMVILFKGREEEYVDLPKVSESLWNPFVGLIPLEGF